MSFSTYFKRVDFKFIFFCCGFIFSIIRPFFVFSLFFTCTETVLEKDWFHWPFHMHTQKFVEKMSSVQFIWWSLVYSLWPLFESERKAWQWILHVKRLNAPFPKNFNLLEWFSTVEFFEFFSTFSPTFICVIETYGSVTFFLCQEKCRNFRILSLWCCYSHEHFHVTGTHKWNNSTPSFSGNWLRNAMLYALRVHACVCSWVRAYITWS